jgi:hypothetical protein
MTNEQPPEKEGEEKYLAKRRLPFETSAFETSGQGRHPGVTAAAILYGVATLACFGLAAYMAFAQHRPLTSIPVIAPAGGGIWFFIRLLMIMRPQAPGN